MMKKIRTITVLSLASCLVAPTLHLLPVTQASSHSIGIPLISTQNPQPQAPSPKPQAPSPGIQSLNPGEKQCYPLKLKSNSFLKVLVEQQGIDVVVGLYGPDRKKLIEVNGSTGIYGTEEFSRILQLSGQYVLEVQSLTSAATSGKYDLTIEGPRVATDQDRAQVEIEQLIADAGKLRKGGKYAEAVPLIEKALNQSEKIFGPEHQLVGDLLVERGVLYFEQGAYAQAKACYERASVVKEKIFGKEHVSKTNLLNNLGSAALMSGHYEEAESLFLQCRTMQEKILGPTHPQVADTLNNLAALYWRKGNFAKAEPLLQQALSLKEKLYGPDHEETGLSLNSLAALYFIRGAFEKAEPLFVRALAIQEKTLGPDHPQVATTINNLGLLYQRKNDLKTAESYLLRALDIRRKALGPDHTEVGISLNNLAVLYRDKLDSAQAVNYYLQAIAVQEKALGATHPEVAKPLSGVAVIYTQQGDYAKALPLLERALAISEQKFGPDHPDVTSNLNNLAAYYRDVGDYAHAEALYRRALTIREKVLGATHPDTALSCMNLATLLYTRGDFVEAEARHRQALAIREKIFGPTHPEVANSLGNLAVLLKEKGDYAASLVLQERALSIWEKTRGADHPSVGLCLHNLGGLYNDLGDREKAEDYHRRALAIFEKKLDPSHRFITQTLINLGAIYKDQGDLNRAEPLFLRALANCEKAALPDNPLMVNCLNNLASLYKARGEVQTATTCFQRALAIGEKQVGRQHPSVATILNNLGVLYVDAGKLDQAEQLYRESLAIREHLLGPDHLEVIASLNNLMNLYQRRSDFDSAIRYQIQCNEATERNVVQNLRSGSERQKTVFLQKTARFLHQTLSLHQQSSPHNQLAAKAALTEIVRRKGRALDAMTSTIATLRNQSDAETRKLLDEYAALASQISILTLEGAGTKPFNDLQEFLKELKRRQETLEVELSRRSAEFKAQISPVTLEAIQKLIPADAVLVEFAIYAPWDVPTQKYGNPRYVAYTLTQDGVIQSADLGDVEPIDAAISEFRKVLGTSRVAVGTSRDLGQRLTQKTPTPTVLAQARKVDQLVMSPVRKLIGTTSHLLISPDGVLNLIPFSALVTEKGRYLIEDSLITYLTSGRDLLRLQVKIPNQQSALVVANPDYADGTGPTLGGRAMKPLTPLPGTGREGKDIQTLMAGSRLVMQAEATKEIVQKTSRPEILHIATHGYFLDDTPKSQPGTATRLLDRVELQEEKLIKIDNPLLRSWLFFAGANREQAAEKSGIMTALEASQLDLWGTKLVVLSACETGLGEVHNGDGVFGLRRALVLAGSESQMMSLWSVSDVGTRDLMVEYYARLKAGEGRSEALRNTQLKMLKDPRRRHPFYWASFIQSGEWGNLGGTR